jgi:hypothetical protein
VSIRAFLEEIDSEWKSPAPAIHRRRKMFIEFVPSGLPFLPQTPRWREPTGINDRLHHFHIEALDVVDVVVSKLRRFHADDISDIEAMIEQGLVSHPELISRFEAAVDFHVHAADAEEVVRCVKHLNRVERDLLVVAETQVALPDWFTDRFG